MQKYVQLVGSLEIPLSDGLAEAALAVRPVKQNTLDGLGIAIGDGARTLSESVLGKALCCGARDELPSYKQMLDDIPSTARTPWLRRVCRMSAFEVCLVVGLVVLLVGWAVRVRFFGMPLLASQ